MNPRLLDWLKLNHCSLCIPDLGDLFPGFVCPLTRGIILLTTWGTDTQVSLNRIIFQISQWLGPTYSVRIIQILTLAFMYPSLSHYFRQCDLVCSYLQDSLWVNASDLVPCPFNFFLLPKSYWDAALSHKNLCDL